MFLFNNDSQVADGKTAADDDGSKKVTWERIYDLADDDGNGTMELDEFESLVGQLYEVRGPPIRRVFETHSNGNATIDKTQFACIMREEISGAVIDVQLRRLGNDVDHRHLYDATLWACCNCGGKQTADPTIVDVCSNVSRGVLLWIIAATALVHYYSDGEVVTNNKDALPSIYFGTSTVSTCGYGDRLVSTYSAVSWIIAIQLWMMFGQQLLVMPWLHKSSLKNEMNCTNPLVLLVTKCTVFVAAWVVLATLDTGTWNVPAGLKDHPTWFHMLYFMSTTMSTVGYGDVFPTGPTVGMAVVVVVHVVMLVMDLFTRSFDDVMTDIARRSGQKKRH